MRNRILTIVFVQAFSIAAIFMYANVAEAQECVTEGLVSFWTFDESNIDGNTLKDVWGKNDGIIEGDPEVVEGRIGEALKFDGDDDYVEVPHDPSIDFPDVSFSIELWLKDPDEYRIFCKGFGGGHGKRYEFWTDLPDLVYCCVDDNATKTNCNTPASANDFEPWHHWVMVRDMDAGSIIMYMDGEEASNCADNTQGSIGNENSLYFTCQDPEEPQGTQGPTACILDEFRIYNRALSPNEVQQNYEATSNDSFGAVSAAGKLAALWGQLKS